MHMGKTIAVKLSEKEQQIISELNKEGMTNSDVLRTALRRYFEELHRTDLLQEPGKRIGEIETGETIMVRDYVEFLKGEIQELRQHNLQLEQQITQIGKQNEQTSHQPLKEREEPPKSIHEQIDEFLQRQNQNRRSLSH